MCHIKLLQINAFRTPSYFLNSQKGNSQIAFSRGKDIILLNFSQILNFRQNGVQVSQTRSVPQQVLGLMSARENDSLGGNNDLAEKVRVILGVKDGNVFVSLQKRLLECF